MDSPFPMNGALRITVAFAVVHHALCGCCGGGLFVESLGRLGSSPSPLIVATEHRHGCACEHAGQALTEKDPRDNSPCRDRLPHHHDCGADAYLPWLFGAAVDLETLDVAAGIEADFRQMSHLAGFVVAPAENDGPERALLRRRYIWVQSLLI